MKRYDAAIVGEIYQDHIFTGFAAWPQPGEEAFTDEYAQEIGGGGAITACALGRLGWAVTLVGSVGAKDIPVLAERLAEFNVPTTDLHGGDGRTGVTVSVSSTADRSFFTSRGQNRFIEDHLKSESVLKNLIDSRHVHFAMPLAASTARLLFPLLHKAACTISLDVGHHPEWLHEKENWETCGQADYFLPNELEARLLCGGGVDRYLDFAGENGWPIGLVKLGQRGAAMSDGDGRWRVEASKIDVIDTTGAGDAFDAGFIDGLLDGVPVRECLRRGCLCGGLSTREAGALQGLPRKDELRETYEQSYR